MRLSPTVQQRKICQVPLSKGDLLMVNAYAGTGKTTTLQMFAQAHAGKRILYLCFNRDMATEAQSKFGSQVECRTTHSLAYLSHGGPYRHKLGMLYIRDMVDRYGVGPRLAAQARTQFLDYLSHPSPQWKREGAPATDVAKRMWEEACDPASPVPMPHDGYLKRWALDQVLLPEYDFVLLDEAQDSNPVIMDFAVRQAQHQASAVLMVGDTHQAIYGWRGAVDAMQHCPHITHKGRLTTCFRFPQDIADKAALFLAHFKNDPVELRGTGGPAAKRQTYAIISRTNSALVEQAWDLLQRKQRPHFSATTAAEHYSPEIPYQFQLLRDVHALRHTCNRPTSPAVRKFRCFEEIESYATGKHDGQRDRNTADGELSGAVSLVKQYGDKLPAMLNLIQQKACPPALATVSLSSAHRAKGQEWDHVKLTEDYYPFHDASKLEKFTTEDANILYVALTRTRSRLVLPDPYHEWFKRNTS